MFISHMQSSLNAVFDPEYNVIIKKQSKQKKEKKNNLFIILNHVQSNESILTFQLDDILTNVLCRHHINRLFAILIISLEFQPAGPSKHLGLF